MKKTLVVLCLIIFIKTFIANTTVATPLLFTSYSDTSKPKITSPLLDSTNVEDSTIYSADSAGASKTVKVKGYYRKDGKYVAPYTRSAPRKKH